MWQFLIKIKGNFSLKSTGGKSNLICLRNTFKKILGKNTILVLTFWCHSQFYPYIFVTINLISDIFKLQ